MKLLPFVLMLAGVFLTNLGRTEAQNVKEEKMKVEVRSDVVCPFCYIGKTNFDKALAEFSENQNIEFVWNSFQLYPHVKTDLDKPVK